MKAILVATIGTRDLMFQISSGEWYNIGDDQMQDGEIIGEQAEVLADLSFSQTSFRDLTHHFYQGMEHYRSRIQPVIIGKLITDQFQQFERVYLIGTDQADGISQRKKDTVFACELIKNWVLHHYNIPTEIITLGTNGENPSNFEQMFRWWQTVWRDRIKPQTEQPILLCLKGCVAQTAEAGRISGLSAYGDLIQFFDFIQNTEINRKGIPSDYIGPILGTNYLWDRTQQQALKLLDRYDYAGAYDVLKPYLQQDTAGFGAIPIWLKAGTAWNRGEFQTFLQLAKSTLSSSEQRQGQQWWWMAYEQAQLAVIRLAQENTTEAMLHSFRAVEGLIWTWIDAHIASHTNYPPQRYPQLLSSICNVYPALHAKFVDQRTQASLTSINLNGYIQQSLIEAAFPTTTASLDYQNFWSQDNRNLRNTFSHRLGGIAQRDLFAAWGQDIQNSSAWQTRILNCLNLITGQSMKSLTQASLFMQIHPKLKTAISDYYPPNP
ncbi:hypothetical protein DO97_03495 [Neosynechococcus sphagnicola sy1]|uniref:CRISPR-associated protein n=1 Tax=Neosynechococcus sphagnicola sy1 TaxID=1497020 RepID=A0A098TKL0_9CYAN|nr:hypothetical protein [Neosynechococcus sphagnicola]KGF72816.1 hypothetical protein DO97_03495 [Neosynechococcus sphagnicola sy1]